MPKAPSSARRFTERARHLWSRALREGSSPREIGVSVGAGVFSACTPLGAHWVIALGLATLLRVNRLWALLASRISILPVYALIIFCEIESAHRIRTGAWASLAPHQAAAQAGQLLGDWVLGMVLFGTALACLAGSVSYAIALAFQVRLKPPRPVPALPASSESPQSTPPGLTR